MSSAAALTLYVATKKGAWTLTASADRREWTIEGPEFLGHIVHHQFFAQCCAVRRTVAPLGSRGANALTAHRVAALWSLDRIAGSARSVGSSVVRVAHSVRTVIAADEHRCRPELCRFDNT